MLNLNRFHRGLAISASSLLLVLLACDTGRTRRAVGGNAGPNTPTNNNNNNNNNGSNNNNNGSNNNGQNHGTASVSLQNFLEYCAKLTACNSSSSFGGISWCANFTSSYVAFAIQDSDPRGITGCIAANKNVKSCDQFQNCLGNFTNQAGLGPIDPGGCGHASPETTCRDTFPEGERICDGAVAVNGPDCRTDCSVPRNARDMNQSCFMDDRGYATCGVADGCTAAGCVGTMQAYCYRGVYRASYDCAERSKHKACVLDLDGSPQCGVEACTESGELCRGSLRMRCYNGVLTEIQDCSEMGLKCASGANASGEADTGCGESYSGCETSDCRSDQVIICDSGAETPVDCKHLDSSLSTCQLAQGFGNGGQFSGMCSAPSGSRNCSGNESDCNGDVAQLCVGGKMQQLDCASTLTDARCVVLNLVGQQDVRCAVPSSGNSGGDGHTGGGT